MGNNEKKIKKKITKKYTPIHSMGNKEALIYEKGVNIEYFYSPYTSPNHWMMKVIEDKENWKTKRKDKTGCYYHLHNSKGKIFDMATPSYPGFLRILKLKNPLATKIEFPNITEVVIRKSFGKNKYKAIYYEIKPGSDIFMRKSASPVAGFILFHSSCEIKKDEKGFVDVVFPKGKTFMAAFGGYEFQIPVIEEAIEWFENKDIYEIKEMEIERWNKYFKRVDNKKLKLPYIEDMLVCLKSQHSLSGGLPSSHNLPYGYSRDNYGAHRGYIALGLHDEARKILDFRYDKWCAFGNLKNAEAMGTYLPRHFSDNEELEQTSYTVISARDYHEAIKDDQYILRIYPMLKWCLKVQLPFINKGMLPFNGDETYIAAGLLGRTANHQGAAEATLMFIVAANWFVDFSKKMNKYEEVMDIDKGLKILTREYRKSFYKDKRLIANNPDRLDGAYFPRGGEGICHQHDYLFKKSKGKKELKILMVFPDGKGHYICQECMENGGYTGEDEKPKEIGAVLLTPAYLRDNIFGKEDYYSLAQRYLEITNEDSFITGHEPALLLYNLIVSDAKANEKDDAYRNLVSYITDVGSVDEYYYDGETVNSMHRPWETGYAIEAIVMYHEDKEKRGEVS